MRSDRSALRADLSGEVEEEPHGYAAKRGLSMRFEQTTPLRGLLLNRTRSAHDKKQEWEHSAEHDRTAILMSRVSKGR